jgi:hypothetical protein
LRSLKDCRAAYNFAAPPTVIAFAEDRRSEP